MADITSIFSGGFAAPSRPLDPARPEVQLIDAMRSAGIDPPDHVTLDGKLHRFKTGSKGHGGGDKDRQSEDQSLHWTAPPLIFRRLRHSFIFSTRSTP